MQTHNEDDRPLIEGGDPAAEASAGDVPGKGEHASPQKRRRRNGFVPISREDVAIIDEIPGTRKLTCLRIWYELAQYANHEKTNEFVLTFEKLGKWANVSAKTTGNCCKDLADTVLLSLSEPQLKHGRFDVSKFRLFPSFPLYRGGETRTAPQEQSSSGGEHLPQEQSSSGKPAHRRKSTPRTELPRNKQPLAYARGRKAREGVKKSENAADANAPHSDLHRKDEDLDHSPDSFFAGVE